MSLAAGTTAGSFIIGVALLEGRVSPDVAAFGVLLTILASNLVDNAIRYSPPGTTVDVAVDATESHARVTVTDGGPGIAEQQRGKVGRRFYRAPGTQAPGSGLRLSIVQRIVDFIAVHCSSTRRRQVSGCGLG